MVVELSARILLAGLVLFLAGVTGRLDFDLALKAGLSTVALGIFGYRLEVRGFRNAGVSGFLAVADAFWIAFLLSTCGLLEMLGALTLIPVVWSVRKHGAPAPAMASLASMAIVGANALREGTQPSLQILGQAGAILAVGLLLGNERVMAQIAMPVRHEVVGTGTPESPDAWLELREKYRELREAYNDLDRRSRRDRLVSALAEAHRVDPSEFFDAVTKIVAQFVGAPKVVLYTVAGYGDALTVRASSGDLPNHLKDSALDVDVKDAPARVRHQSEKAIEALRQVDGVFSNVLLNHRGRIVGMLCLIDDRPDKLQAAERLAEEASDVVANIVNDAMERQVIRRRLREAEVLYDVATIGQDLEDRVALSQRFVRDLGETLEADSLEIVLMLDGRPMSMARHGRECDFLQDLSFAAGPGIDGWIGIGSPELLMFDVRRDDRVPSAAAIRHRVGSFLVIPLSDGERILGYALAATTRQGGLDLGAAETLRIAAYEMGHVLARRGPDGGGIMSIRDLNQRIQSQEGSLVVLQPLRMETLLESYGRPALASALRIYARRIRSRLPVGGAVAKRPNDELVAFLPGMTAEQAGAWANEMAASASLIGLRTPDGSTRLPLGIRAKVASVGPKHPALLLESAS